MARPKTIVTKEESVQTQSPAEKRLTIDLGDSWKKGDIIPEDVYAELISAGFTDDRLFGTK
jgi:hypothetical protein